MPSTDSGDTPPPDLTTPEFNTRFIQSFILRSMFWRPSYLESSAWLEHIPFAFWLMEAHQPQVLVELGTHYGTSYFAFCQTITRLNLNTRCFAIDTWLGDKHSGFYDEKVFEKVRTYNETHYSGFSSLLRTTFDDALGYFADGSIDLLHIDGLHTYDAVRHDFYAWLPKLSNRALVILHDTNVKEREFGVSKLFEELKSIYPTFDFIHGHGLGIIKIGSEQNEAIKNLFIAARKNPTKQALEEIFSRLGKSCADSFASQEQQKVITTYKAQAEQQNTKLSNLLTLLEKNNKNLDRRTGEFREAAAERESRLEYYATERGQLLERLDLLQEVRSELKEENKQLKDKINYFTTEKSRKEQELYRLSYKNLELEQHLESLQAELAIKEEQLQKLANSITLHQEENNSLHTKLSELKKDFSELADLLNQKDKRIVDFKTTIDRCEQEKNLLQTNLVNAIHENQQHKKDLLDSEATTKAKYVEIARVSEELRKAQKKATELLSLTQIQAKSLGERFNEIAALTKTLEKQDQEFTSEITYQKKRYERLQNSFWWRITMPFQVLFSWFKNDYKKDQPFSAYIKIIKKSGLFDEAWYIQQYQDIANRGVDPITHYVLHGAVEGRNPSANFNTKKYIDDHPIVLKTKTNPLVHYIKNRKLAKIV